MPTRIPLTLLALLAAGCAAPPQAQRAAQIESDAVARLAAASAADSAALRASVAALLDIRRASIAHDAEISIAALLLSPAGDPDPAALDDDLALEEPRTALAQSVRAGLLTAREARAWLHDYALAARMTATPEPRAVLLAQLAPLRAHDAAADALLAALDARAAATNSLAADAAATAATLHDWTNTPALLTPDSQQLLLALWRLSAAANAR